MDKRSIRRLFCGLALAGLAIAAPGNALAQDQGGAGRISPADTPTAATVFCERAQDTRVQTTSGPTVRVSGGAPITSTNPVQAQSQNGQARVNIGVPGRSQQETNQSINTNKFCR